MILTLTFGAILSRGIGNVVDKAVYRITGYRSHKVLAPPEIRELAADCIMTGREEACNIAFAWKPPE